MYASFAPFTAKMLALIGCDSWSFLSDKKRVILIWVSVNLRRGHKFYFTRNDNGKPMDGHGTS